ncbi:hypothetical protein [Streptomyces sp. NRRL F-5135]|uniref:hypothetical protein n=1 Tax=Streptomyces sp. NRRL F-5135 TaxID=1463858 RepID=UPI000A68BB14|nr:hypothetical protein [Streptomyces sp. NRRL F-5135]
MTISSLPDLQEWIGPVVASGGRPAWNPALAAAYALQRDGAHVHYVADGHARCLGGHSSCRTGSS